MSTNPFYVLQTAAFRREVTASQLVRAAAAVAAAAGDNHALGRFRKELNGYDAAKGEASDMPQWRLCHARVVAQDLRGRMLPVAIKDPDTARALSECRVVQALPAIEAMLSGDRSGGTFGVEFEPVVEAQLRSGMSGVSMVYRLVEGPQYMAVLEGARQAVFDWALDKVSTHATCSAEIDLAPLLPAVDGHRQEPMIASGTVNVTATNSSVVIQSPAATSSAVAQSGADQEALKDLIAALGEALGRAGTERVPHDALVALQSSLDELRALAALKAPRREWVVDAAKSVKAVLEQAAGSVIGTLMTPHVHALVARLIG